MPNTTSYHKRSKSHIKIKHKEYVVLYNLYIQWDLKAMTLFYQTVLTWTIDDIYDKLKDQPCLQRCPYS